VSVGGNDALDHLDFLSASASSVADVLGRLSAIAETFERMYHQMVQAVMQHRLPTALCTIYYPRFPEPELQRIAISALTVFNDVVIREAIKAAVPLIDLCLICDADADYANSAQFIAVCRRVKV
jgi:lysophospholipase L1-like esterase